MTVVVFENPGEIDPRLISTFGVNVKEGENPIGFFGTGLKYAIAILLRTGNEITIQSGERILTFAKHPTEIRGKTFELIAMNGEPLGFTTDVGKSWELWMAYRELHCNAKDERGMTFEAACAPAPATRVTRVLVRGADFVAVHRERRRYFLESPALLISDDVEIHEGESHGIFYRGVRVADVPSGQKTRFTYNLLHTLDLTEDRVAKYIFIVASRIRSALFKATAADVVRDGLTAGDGYLEATFDYKGEIGRPSEPFLRSVEDLIRDRVATTNASAVGVYKAAMRAQLKPDTIPLTGVEEQILARAKAFCARLGFTIQYDIIIAESLGEGVLGMAEDGRIYLAQRAFMMGTKTVAGTLIEEFIHLKHGLSDTSRAMQNYLLDRLVSLGEQLNGEPL